MKAWKSYNYYPRDNTIKDEYGCGEEDISAINPTTKDKGVWFVKVPQIEDADKFSVK